MNDKQEIIAFIDSSCSFNTSTIKNSGCGASEYQFYNLLLNIKNYYNIYCFNTCSVKYTLDNIIYVPINKLKNYTNINFKFIVIQRFINLDIYKNINKFKIYLLMNF